MRSKNPAVESLRHEQKSQRKNEGGKTPDKKLTTALKATFPASDPIAQQVPVKPGTSEARA